MAFLLLKNEVKPTVKAAKEISPIKYNFLNLPRLINTAQGDMELWYDATGAKQKKTVTGAGGYTKEYANGVEYKDGELEAIYTGDGRILYEPATTDDDGNLIPERYRYEFTLSDHLGNARVTFSDLDDDGFITLADNPDTEDVEEPVEMLQENHYYPFGMNMEGSWSPQVGVKNQYQYNGSKNLKGKGSGKSFSGGKPGDAASYNQGSEYTQDLELEVNMSFYRTYDPAIGRFWNVDPLAEKFYDWSVYTGNLDNPIRYADPEGDCPNPPCHQTITPKLPTQGTANLMSDGLSKMKGAFFGEAKFEPKIGLGGEFELGPVKGKGEFNLIKGSFKATDDGAEVGFKIGQGEISGELVGAKGKVKGQIASSNAPFGLDDSSGPSGEIEGSIGKMTMDNSTNVSVSGSLGPVKVKGGVNLGKLADGASDLIEGGVQYIGEQMSRKIKEWIPFENK